jgi:hypothetical protein
MAHGTVVLRPNPALLAGWSSIGNKEVHYDKGNRILGHRFGY